jgi:hypothetical protein
MIAIMMMFVAMFMVIFALARVTVTIVITKIIRDAVINTAVMIAVFPEPFSVMLLAPHQCTADLLAPEMLPIAEGVPEGLLMLF